MRKKAYSVLFFISLMTGLVQPVLPLMEYYAFQESIIELFCINKDHPEMHCDGHCYLQKRIEKAQKEGNEFPATLLAFDRVVTLYLPLIIPPGLRTPESLRTFPDLEQRYKSLVPESIFHPPDYHLS